MKFFAALIAKLTGQADAPKTLEQARATFGEAKSALDQVAAMFAAAALDFDAMLTKGANALKDHLGALQAKIDGLEATQSAAVEKTRDAEGQLATATAKIESLDSQLSALSSLLGSVGFKCEVGAKPEALQTAWNTHVANATTQKLAELGIKQDKLPSAAAHDEAVSGEDLRAQLAATNDPAERGRIAAKLNALRDAEQKAPAGRN